ncbi:uncharacterized protein F5Z01DRAFT_674214 [Emericellopsis atlantica]|uniref:Zn(2)-C6 fungal-type domain-containing protein n=1 Tax=Emericellopsis atlantica TaxID=2614577 RepID=A0A9P8CR88_9HYPO|nr:uncharacterized protein F5Z01DRAFT_674214 [Emericellopsis atlantica]KAG9254476.1 hypothetical protein F5Z01DRAFT_674214 [Emericellopsis atlantica]
MTPSPLRRRNGRPQACDPCRARKVACDHGQPTCNRCQRRGQTCVYTLSAHSAMPARRSASTASSSTGDVRMRDHDRDPSAPGKSRPAGYLGLTSYSAVLEETSNSLSYLQGTPSFSVLPPRDDELRAVPGELSSLTREMCLVVLRYLRDLIDRDVLPRLHPGPHDIWPRIVGVRVLESLKQTMGRHPSEEKLYDLARRLCANTAKPMVEEANTTSDEWMAQLTGEKLRWESIGLLFTFSELFGDTADQPPSYHSPYGGVNVKCVGVCIELVRMFADANVLLLYLCFRRNIMESMTVGDAGFACWRAHAESISLLTFMGIHADQPTSTPTFMAEMRARLFARIFTIDKVSVSFQGRPCLISGRYVTTPLPRDIPDGAFMGGPEALRLAASQIGDDGWFRGEEIPSVTLGRARLMIAYVKDELMEVALSQREKPHIEVLLDLKRRAQATSDSFPPSLAYSPHDIEDASVDTTTVFGSSLARIEHLQNLFLAERLLLKRPDYPQDRGELLEISYNMVLLTVKFWVHKDRFAEMSGDYGWLVMNYAAPGGGILCMELLKGSVASSTVSRSAMIQQLSLLVGFLGWVSSDAPNAELCASCRTIIQRVLDHALNHPGAPLTHDDGIGDGRLADDGIFFHFDLLDTYEWLRPDEMAALDDVRV